MGKDIVKSNALIEASYKPASLTQMRLLLAALMQIKATDKLSYKTEFVVTAGGLADLTGNAMKQNYRLLERAAKELMEMIITVPYRPNGDERQPVKRMINVVDCCDYYEGKGCVQLQFTRSIMPYISELSSHFTRYKARYVMPMRSSYGIRLYELCLQWISFGSEREFTITEFKKLLGLEGKKAYFRLDVLKRKVIKPALADINKHTDLQITFGNAKPAAGLPTSSLRSPGSQGCRKRQRRKLRSCRSSVRWAGMSSSGYTRRL